MQNKGIAVFAVFKDELEAQSFLFTTNRIAKYSSGRFPSSSNLCLKSYKCA